MRAITLYTDVHIFGPHEMTVHWDYRNLDHYYLGDNIDVSHCNRRLVHHAKEAAIRMSDRFAGRCVKGNHELSAMRPEVPVYLRVGNALLHHGHYLFWTAEKCEKYLAKIPGMPGYKIPFTLPAWDFLRYIAKPGINSLFRRQVASLAATYNVDTIICGHRHPPHRIETVIDDIRIVILPRGKHVVEID